MRDKQICDFRLIWIAVIAAFAVCIYFVSAELLPGMDKSPRGTVNMIIANREHLNDREVTVEGYGRCQFEGRAIYQDLSDLKRLNFEHALWIQIDANDPLWQTFKSSDGRFIKITGRLNLRETGHGGFYAGAIEDIKEVIRK